MSAEDAPEGDEELLQRLETLGISLSETRSKAIDWRESCGIEKEWAEDEEYFEGIDDANRGEVGAWTSKPLGQAAIRDPNATSSTVFPNITRAYCEAAAARVGDMLLPTDDRGWSLGTTPIPEMVGFSKGEIPRAVKGQIAEQAQSAGQNPGDIEQQLIEQVKEELAQARAKAEKAEKRIEDWHIESQYHAHMRQVIEDAARIGSGVLKGPVPEKRRALAYINGQLQIREEIKPGSRRIDPWNFYPGQCGENIHDAPYTWERDEITKKDLIDLLGMDGYVDSQIELCLQEEPHKAVAKFDRSTGSLGLAPSENKHAYEIWYFYGQLSREDMESLLPAEEEGEESEVSEKDTLFAHIAMVNNRVIKAILNPLDTGEFPYDMMIWQRRHGLPWGIGVARQIRTPQRMIVGAVRNMMDNAGLAGGPMWAYMQGVIEPINGVYGLMPRKGWRVNTDDPRLVDHAFKFFEIPMLQDKLQAIVELGLRMAEDVSGLPLLMQGQQGKAPDTVGGMQILNNNASTVLRRIARLFDDLITEPHVRRYYSYLLQYGEDDEKGDFVIDARGSSALVERDLQNMQIMQMGTMVVNPVFGLDPKKWAIEFLKSQRLDPKKFEFDDEEWRQVVQQLSQPQQDNRAEIDKLKIDSNEAIKAAELRAKAAEGDKERAHEAALAEFKAIIEQEEAAGNRSIEIDWIKKEIFSDTAKLRLQERLSETQVLTPPVEPAGRAPEGQAFQR